MGENLKLKFEKKNMKYKVFIGGLPPKVTEDELLENFNKCNKSAYCKIMSSKSSNENRGFAFIIFEDEESYQDALNNPKYIHGRRIECKEALNKKRAKKKVDDEKYKKIFVGGLSRETSEEDLNDYFSKFGEVYKAYLIYDKFTNVSRCFGFVEYKESEIADKVIETKNHKINGKVVELKKIQLKEESDEK